MPEPDSTPTAEPAGSDAQPDTGGPAEEKQGQAGTDEADEPAPGYADFQPATSPG